MWTRFIGKQGKEVFVSQKNEVKDWLSGKLSYTLHKPARKRFKRNRTTVFYVNELFQLDLIDLRSLRRYNDGATFILTVIDVFSKMAFAKILRDKRADTVLRAFTDILRESGRTPTKVETDQGLEFTNTKFQRELEKRGITFFTTYSENKASVVERFNRTLKTRMWVFFTNNNTYRYVDVLPDLLKAYNSSPHSSIKGRTPESVTEDNNLKVWRESHAAPKSCGVKLKFRVGDKVRISRDKGVFEKGYEHNWSEEYFIIHKARRRTPPVYVLKDLNGEILKGIFYEQQLQRVSPDEVYVIKEV